MFKDASDDSKEIRKEIRNLPDEIVDSDGADQLPEEIGLGDDAEGINSASHPDSTEAVLENYSYSELGEKNTDISYPSNSEVTINNERYRTDDNGQPHMKYNSEAGTWEILPNIEYTINGYTYETNEKEEILHVHGTIHMKEHEGRKPLNDDVPNMQEGDDRGHLIADQFGGSNRLDNLVPMDMHLNRGEYKKMEESIAKAKTEGKEVNIDIGIKYDESGRPTKFQVSVTINGETEVHVFSNESQGGY
mgnify:FL=1